MHLRWPVLLGLVAGLAALATGFSFGHTPTEDWQLAARYTARVGFPLLILAYIARPLHQLRPSGFSKTILARRKWIGLGFAFSHTIHFAALVTFFRVSGTAPEPVTVIFGGFAYILLWAMALTSTAAAQRAMGRWWKRLHRTGIHYLWFIFAQSYLGRIFDPDRMEIGLVLAPIAFAASGIRLAAWLKSRRKREILVA